MQQIINAKNRFLSRDGQHALRAITALAVSTPAFVVLYKAMGWKFLIIAAGVFKAVN
jgi:hypothetical protein